jgi:hypothetical protein
MCCWIAASNSCCCCGVDRDTYVTIKQREKMLAGGTGCDGCSLQVQFVSGKKEKKFTCYFATLGTEKKQ